MKANVPPKTAIALLAAASVLAGCSAPSLHGIHTTDKAVDDSDLAGVWTDGDTVAKVERTGFGEFTVHAMISNDAKSASVVTFDLRLVELSGVRFGDLSLDEPQQSGLYDAHAGLAIATHQFVKIERTGDKLTVWTPDEDRLLAGKGKGLRHVVLSTSKSAPKAVISAQTAEIQKYFAKHARDPSVFDSQMVLRRGP